MNNWIKASALGTVISVSMVVCVLPTRAVPPAQPPAGLIAFVSDRTGQNEIYSMKTDGTDVKALTDSANGASSIAPVWSPDGNHLLHFQRTKAEGSLVITDADGGQPITLVTVQAPDVLINSYIYVDWSADSQRLIYGIMHAADITKGESLATIAFYTVHQDGSNNQLLNPSGISSPAMVRFLKDGSLIAAVQDDETVYHLDSAGNQPVQLPLKSFYMIFMSLSRDQFASTTDRSNSVDVFNLKTNTAKTIVKIPAIGLIREMRWSPDGTLLWIQGDEAPDFTATPHVLKPVTKVTYIISLDGLTAHEFLKDLDSYGNRLSWSPDSQYLAYDAKEGGAYQVFVSRPDGSEKVKLTSEGANFQPAWQP